MVRASLMFALAGTSVYGLAIQQPKLTPRDLQTVTGVLSSVQSAIDGLDSAFKSWNTVTDLQPLLDASNKLDSVLKSGTTTVTSSAPLSLKDTVRIIKPVQDLEAHAKTLVQDLKAKLPMVQQGGLCDIFASVTGGINTDGQALTKATVNKVPQIAQGVAAKVAQPIIDTLKEATDAFAPQNCRNAV